MAECSRTVPEYDSFLLRDVRRGWITCCISRGRSEVLAGSLLGVHRGSSFCGQGPSHLSLLSPVQGLGPQGLCGGSWAVHGLSAGNLLQGPQGCLQGHIHSVADGFRVVCHRVTSALEGREGGC